MRREADMLLATIPARFDKIEGRVSDLEVGLSSNTATTNQVKEDTSLMVAFVNDVAAVWRFCKAFRRVSFRFAKWIATLSAAVTGVVAAAHAIGAVDVRTWFR